MKTLRKTRIICTLGPATGSVEKIRALIQRGMNIARFNFSHGEHRNHGELIAMVREAARLEETQVGLLLDTKGPEIRTGVIQGSGTVVLNQGDPVDVIAEADAVKRSGEEGAFTRPGRITISYTELADDVKPGVKILIADGLMALEVLSLAEGRVMKCRVVDGGELGSRKNVNIIGVHTRLPAISEKDRDDLRFGHEENMDYVAASFIRTAQDVITIQKFLASIGSAMPVIAKIEDEQGLDNIEDIVRVAGGIMVARGDLGVQIPPERVPLAQKRIITLCNELGKPVITATQMLDSMIHNPRPTRAEAADVANAILDGTDCIMLSGETSAGNYPEEAVEVMNRIALETEDSSVYRRLVSGRRRHWEDGTDLGQVIASAAVDTAGKIGASCLITPTLSGRTAMLLSKFRPLPWIVAASPDDRVRRRLLLYPGVAPLEAKVEDDSEAMIQNVIGAAIRGGFARPGDKVVVAAGMPVHSPISSNSIRVHIIGTILGRGTEGFGGQKTGRIVRAQEADEASWAVGKKGGEILLAHTLDISFIPIIPEVAGIIIEGSSELSGQQLRGLNPDLVFVAHVERAMSLFEDGQTVTMDGTEMMIYEGSV